MGAVLLLSVIAVVIVVLVRRHQKPATSTTPDDNDISDDARYVDAGDIDPLTRPAGVLTYEPIGECVLAAYTVRVKSCGKLHKAIINKDNILFVVETNEVYTTNIFTYVRF